MAPGIHLETPRLQLATSYAISLAALNPFPSSALPETSVSVLAGNLVHQSAQHWQPAHEQAHMTSDVRQNIIHAELHFHKRDSDPRCPCGTLRYPVLPFLLPRFRPHDCLRLATSAAHSQVRESPAAPHRQIGERSPAIGE